jgi:hypothetical protein
MDLGHKDRLTCPWCGREVTAIDLSRAKGRKSLRQTELTVLIHAKGDALFSFTAYLYYFSSFFAASFLVSAAASASVSSVSSSTGAL